MENRTPLRKEQTVATIENEAEFLSAFGEYCFGKPGQEPRCERERLGRKFSWYETHLANMLADYVESGNHEGMAPGRWAALREQMAVDVVLCPQEFQKLFAVCDEMPHSPLYEQKNCTGIKPSQWVNHVVAIEMKNIPNTVWKERWESAFADLRGKTTTRGGASKPHCDYLIACMYGFRSNRAWKAEWYLEAFDEFRQKNPKGQTGNRLKLRLAASEAKEGLPREFDYLARWPEAPHVVEIPALKWNGKDWSATRADIFLALLAPSGHGAQ